MPKPRIEIDPKRVEAFAQLGSPAAEIADALGVSEATDSPPVCESSSPRQPRSEEFGCGNFSGTSAEVWECVPMQIFLGKHELGQGDEGAQVEERTIVRRMVKRG